MIISTVKENTLLYILTHRQTQIWPIEQQKAMILNQINIIFSLSLFYITQNFNFFVIFPVLVSTASATDEFSWARYCDTIDTCLGDYYSTVWMEHMDLVIIEI